jgi:4-azaleucine resistance transporter AzlC
MKQNIKNDDEKIKALKAAFPITIPVLTGYLFLGMGYGILMDSIGYGLGWTALMSLLIFAGSIQYVSIALLTSAFNPIYTLLLTIVVNARHIFYGISMLEKYKGAGKLKPYLIFGLTDETFSILSTMDPPEGVQKKWFQFFVTLLNHCYWVSGSVLGNVVGSMVSFNTKGLDFVLTALFTVIFIDQWKGAKKHGPALIGLGASLLCLVIIGKENYLIPAMIMILFLLTIFRKKIENTEKNT